jgi:Contractile injection system tape measure protein
MADNHKINKVVLDFSFSKKEKNTALQDARAFFYDKALPQLNSFFKTTGQTIYIDKLEIDLNKTTARDFENDFIKALAKSFEMHVQAPGKKIKTIQKKPPGFDADNIFFYLLNGYWHWVYQQKNGEEISVLLQQFFTREESVFQLLKRLEQQELLPAERLINLVSDNDLLRNSLIGILIKQHPALSLILPALPAGWKIKAGKPENFYFFFTRELLTNPPLRNVHEIIILLKKIITRHQFSNSTLAKDEKQTGDKKIKFQKTTESVNNIEALKIFFANIDNQPLRKVIIPDLLTEDQEPCSAKPETNIGETEPGKISIPNAGLLLFHPYLVYVFSELNWLTADKKFVNRKVQQKAILFLQYIINEKSRQAEHRLVLNKLICGWPIHMPLKNSCNLSALEKAAASDLVESLKEHWTVVKNTSTPGLIQSFVFRPGLIQKTQNGFLVQVERRTIDILLDSLPFGLTIIKFPWNEYIINTEW